MTMLGARRTRARPELPSGPELFGVPLAPRDLLILLVLAEGPTHGYGVVTGAERYTDSDVPVDPANLYRALHRMDRDGWVERDEASEVRTMYALTDAGRRILGAEVRRLQRVLKRARTVVDPEQA